jgi:hypothetical protein
MPADDSMPDASSDKPFDDEPFDAGVEADEKSDPKKYIEQLTGKLGQTLRTYNDDQGQPDFTLEKFVLNSLISATHTSEMDEQDQNDIIDKIKEAGNDDDNQDDTQDDNNSGDSADDTSGDEFGGDMGDNQADGNQGFGDVNEEKETSIFLENPKKNNMFQPGSNDILETDTLTENETKVGSEVTYEGAKWKITNIVGDQIFMSQIQSDGTLGIKTNVDKSKFAKLNENIGESKNYMFWQNLKTIHHAAGELLKMNQEKIDSMVANGHAWAVDHISTSSDDIEEVYHFFEANLKGDLKESEKRTIFGKIKNKLKETFNQEENMAEPIIEPQIKPVVTPSPDKVQPNIAPSRKNKPFLPMREAQPDPKAKI